MRPRIGLASLLLVAALAGCSEPFGATIDCDEHLARNAGEARLTILVTDEPGGPPLAGALLFVQAWGTCWEQKERLESGDDGTAVLVAPASGRADIDAHLEGHTPERLAAAHIPSAGRAAVVELPLYKARLSREFQDAFMGHGVGRTPLGLEAAEWRPAEMSWDGPPLVRAAYAERILQMTVTLAWNNTATEFADLAIGMGRTANAPDVVADVPGDQGGAGAQREEMTLGLEAMYNAGWQGANALHVGPYTEKPHVALNGIAYVLRVDALFGAPRDNDTPSPLWLLLAATAGALLLRRGRRGARR